MTASGSPLSPTELQSWCRARGLCMRVRIEPHHVYVDTTELQGKRRSFLAHAPRFERAVQNAVELYEREERLRELQEMIEEQPDEGGP